MAQKLLVVIGATGVQGRSVINAILADSATKADWKIRGVTRDTTGPKAKALQDLGVEPVAADTNDKASLAKAFAGAYAVFGVTNFWEKADPAVEQRQGRNIADAAKEVGVKHLVWSSLYNVSEETKGKITAVEHFDGKAKIEEYIRQIGVPASFVMMGFYMSNFTKDHMLRHDPSNNTYSITFPFSSSAPMPLIDTYADAGKFVKGALLAGPSNQRILASAAYYTGSEILATFAKVYPNAGKGAAWNAISVPQFTDILKGAGMPESAAVDLAGNMQWIGEYGYYHGAELEPSQKLVKEKLTTWEDHVRSAPEFKGLN